MALLNIVCHHQQTVTHAGWMLAKVPCIALHQSLVHLGVAPYLTSYCLRSCPSSCSDAFRSPWARSENQSLPYRSEVNVLGCRLAEKDMAGLGSK